MNENSFTQEKTFTQYVSDEMLDAAIEYVVTSDVERWLAEIEADEVDYTPSMRHERRMRALFNQLRRAGRGYANLRWLPRYC